MFYILFFSLFLIDSYQMCGMEYDPTIFQVTDNTDILDGLVFELPKIDNSSDKTSTNVNLESTQIGTYDPAIFQVTDDSAVLNNLVLKLPRKKGAQSAISPRRLSN